MVAEGGGEGAGGVGGRVKRDYLCVSSFTGGGTPAGRPRGYNAGSAGTRIRALPYPSLYLPTLRVQTNGLRSQLISLAVCWVRVFHIYIYIYIEREREREREYIY